MTKNNKLPQEIVDHWPEIFKDVEINTVPIEYLHGIRVKFKDGKDWFIDMRKRSKDSTLESVENDLEEFFQENDERIQSVEFNLNTAKVKKDVETRTKQFLKRRK